MTRKKIIFKCKSCGKEAKPDHKEKNWNIFTKMKCKCGGKLEFKIN